MSYSNLGLRAAVAMRNKDDRHRDNMNDLDIVATHFLPRGLEVKKDLNKGYDDKHFMWLTLLLHHRRHELQRNHLLGRLECV